MINNTHILTGTHIRFCLKSCRLKDITKKKKNHTNSSLIYVPLFHQKRKKNCPNGRRLKRKDNRNTCGQNLTKPPTSTFFSHLQSASRLSHSVPAEKINVGFFSRARGTADFLQGVSGTTLFLSSASPSLKARQSFCLLADNIMSLHMFWTGFFELALRVNYSRTVEFVHTRRHCVSVSSALRVAWKNALCCCSCCCFWLNVLCCGELSVFLFFVWLFVCFCIKSALLLDMSFTVYDTHTRHSSFKDTPPPLTRPLNRWTKIDHSLLFTETAYISILYSPLSVQFCFISNSTVTEPTHDPRVYSSTWLHRSVSPKKFVKVFAEASSDTAHFGWKTFLNNPISLQTRVIL